MTLTPAELAEAIAEIDARVADTVRHMSAKWMQLGYHPHELPVVMRPMLEELAKLRGRQRAGLEAMLARHADAPRALH